MYCFKLTASVPYPAVALSFALDVCSLLHQLKVLEHNQPLYLNRYISVIYSLLLVPSFTR